jgi:hypothetical protein
MMELLGWLLCIVLLSAWGIIEFRRYLQRADETVESDLIAETNRAFEEWLDSDPDRLQAIAWRKEYKRMVEDKR